MPSDDELELSDLLERLRSSTAAETPDDDWPGVPYELPEGPPVSEAVAPG